MKITSMVHHGRHRWRVSWQSAGRTRRNFFKSQSAAKTWAARKATEFKTNGERWAAVPEGERALMMQARDRATRGGYSLEQACVFYEQNAAMARGSLNLRDLVGRFMAAKRAKGLRSESIRLLETTLDQFLLGREELPAGSITTADVAAFLAREDWGPWRRRGAIIDLGNLFNWSVRAGMVLRNPVGAIERPSIEHKVPKILTPDQCADLLKLCARRKHKVLLPWLSIALFAGLRPAELERLRWEDVNAQHIALASDVTKGRARRLVRIRPVLSAWLKDHRKESGMVCVKNHRKRIHRLRRAFGGLPKNVLRHSFISYALAKEQDVQALALEAGNSPEMIFRHYRELVTPAAAKEFWCLRP